MKSLIKNSLKALSIMFLFAGTSWAVSISSTGFSAGFTPTLLLQPNESLSWSIVGTATGTITLQTSNNSLDNYRTVTGVNFVTNGAVSQSGTVFNGNIASYYRFYISTITAGSYVTNLSDRDDFVSEVRNLKYIPILQVFDDHVSVNGSLYLGRAVYNQANGGSTLAVQSTTQITPTILDKSFSVLTSTGMAISMVALPTIATTTATAGDIYIIQSATNTITLTDNGTLAGSLLELGAATRALGVGDILAVIYRGGSWWELFFANN